MLAFGQQTSYHVRNLGLQLIIFPFEGQHEFGKLAYNKFTCCTQTKEIYHAPDPLICFMVY